MARKKRVPGYLLHKASGQARVVLDGRTYYLGPYGSEESHKEYGRLIEERDADGPDSVSLEGAPEEEIILTIVIDKYVTWAKGYYRTPEGKCTGQFPSIKQALKPLHKFYGHVPVGDFGPKALKTIQHHLLERTNPRTGKPLSRKGCRSVLT